MLSREIFGQEAHEVKALIQKIFTQHKERMDRVLFSVILRLKERMIRVDEKEGKDYHSLETQQKGDDGRDRHKFLRETQIEGNSRCPE